MIASFAAFSLGAFAWGQAPAPATVPPEPALPPVVSVVQRPPARFSVTVAPRYRYVFKSDLEDTGTGIQVSRTSLDFALSYSVNQRIQLTGGFNFENNRYDFERFGDLIPGTDVPIDSGRMFTFTPGIRYVLSERWSIGTNAVLRRSGDEDAKGEDSRESGAAFYGRYVSTPALSLVFGATFQSQIEEDNLILPIIGISWQISPKSRFDTQGLANGFSGQYTYRASPTVSAFFRAGFERRNFRLKDSGTFANGVFRDYGSPVEIGALFKPDRATELNVSFGAVIGQQYRLDDPVGRERFDRTQDPALFINLLASRRF